MLDFVGGNIMVRTQIQLTERQACELKQRAERENISMAELIRRSVDDLLSKEDRAKDERWERAKNAIGFLKGGPPDLSTNHDKYLAEAYAGEDPQD
jgi:hypothetical protein